MQFAGMRTDLDLNPVGEQYNMLVALSDDTLPDPGALMITGITPQQTLADGYSEADFADILMNEVFTPGTVAVGYNNIRFDDEFIRMLFWRNFYDPYEWSWRDDRSRWDMLDVVRMTRALRPDGIQWPVIEGKPSNRLEHLSRANDLRHDKAHDAFSDVEALIAIAKLIRDHQPQLFSYLFDMRSKNQVRQLVNLDDKRPFVYTSGRYGSEHDFTTVAFPLTSSRNGNIVVYDLRYDPEPLLELSQKDLRDRLFANREARLSEGFVKVPVKEFQYNRVPAVAPIGVLSQGDGWQKIGLDQGAIEAHRDKLLSVPAFAENIRTIFENRPEFEKSIYPEGQLYDGFVADVDSPKIASVRLADENELADMHPEFVDERLAELLTHYKARNYPKSLSADEREAWEEWRSQKIQRELPTFIQELQKYAESTDDESKQFVLRELHLWAESIVPSGY